MTASRMQRIMLATGVELAVATYGDPAAPAVILLHGFPESHRTWRSVAPLLADRFHCIVPDQRGFGASDQPQDVAEYASDKLIADIFALADAFGAEQFALVGHDWGGAIAWAAAIGGDPRLTKLGIVNSPHPAIFQKSLIEDEAQRAASQYITAFRQPGMEAAIAAMGIETFFDKSFARHVDMTKVSAEERQRYIDDWSRPGAMTAMLNWYRATKLVVPPMGASVPLRDLTLPSIRIPTLVVWGMRDLALLPIQLDGLDEVVEDLTIVRLPEAGHFAPWEAPEAVAGPLLDFL